MTSNSKIQQLHGQLIHNPPCREPNRGKRKLKFFTGTLLHSGSAKIATNRDFVVVREVQGTVKLNFVTFQTIVPQSMKSYLYLMTMLVTAALVVLLWSPTYISDEEGGGEEVAEELSPGNPWI